MRQISLSALVAQPAARMYALINDIEHYPEFIPWCTAAQVVNCGPGELLATLSVRRGLLRAQFTTRNLLYPEHSIRMQLVQGPFRSLQGGWTLTPINDAAAGTALGCRVALDLQFEFANALTARLFEPLFEEAAGSLMDAFVARAKRAS